MSPPLVTCIKDASALTEKETDLIMVAKVTPQGLIIPPDLLVGIEAVEIRKEKDRITLVPTTTPDPILNLGKSPVPCSAPNASELHDKYLYGKP